MKSCSFYRYLYRWFTFWYKKLMITFWNVTDYSDQSNRKFKLPDLDTNYQILRNPLDEDSRIGEWVERTFQFSGLDEKKIKKLKVTRLFTAYFLPLCSDINRYKNLVRYFVLLFILDDHTECEWGDMASDVQKAHDIWGQAMEISVKILNKEKFTSICDWKPYVVYFYSVFENICNDLNDVSKRRLFKIFNDYCLANIQQTINKIENKPTLESLEDMIKVIFNCDMIFLNKFSF